MSRFSSSKGHRADDELSPKTRSFSIYDGIVKANEYSRIFGVESGRARRQFASKNSGAPAPPWCASRRYRIYSDNCPS